MMTKILSNRSTLAIAFALLVLGTQRALLSSIQEKHRLSSSEHIVIHKSASFHDSKESLPFPLYIGAGQGTTGTRSVHAAVCALGIPSVHYNRVCFRGKGISTSNSTIFPSDSVERGITAHLQAIASWKRLSECVSEARSNVKICHEAMDIITNMTNQVAQVVSSGVGAVHDVPYTLMIPYLVNLSKRERGIDPILLLAERNPNEWAIRRVESHGDTPQLICNDTNGAFDLQYCMEKESNVDNLLFAYDNIKSKDEQEVYISTLAEAMDHFQTGIRQLSPDFQINMFELDSKIDVTNLAQLIWGSTRHKLSPEAVHQIHLCRENGGLEVEINTKQGIKLVSEGKRKNRYERGRFSPYARISRRRKLD